VNSILMTVTHVKVKIDMINSVSFVEYQKERKEHWNTTACRMDTWRSWGGYYHRHLSKIYRFLVSPGQKVLEVGCAHGDLLASLKPSFGVGVDFSEEMLVRARERHPELHFSLVDAHEMDLTYQDALPRFDVIILSDLVNDLWDVQTVLEQVSKYCAPHTRIIINTYSRLWEYPLAFSEKLGLAKPTLGRNWMRVEDVNNLLYLADFEVIRTAGIYSAATPAFFRFDL